VALVLAAIPAFFTWETFRAVRQARDRAASAASLRVAIRPLERPLPDGVDTVGAPAVFRDAAIFHGHLFIAGPQGLAEYDADGTLVRRFRTGLELPPAPIAGLATGVLAASAGPALLIATAGEGLLTFDGRRLTQARPEEAGQRKLTAILPLASGRVLLGTDASGLFAFDGQRLTPAHPELAGVAVTALSGTDGDVWIGTRDRGLWHWRAGGVERFGEADGLPDARVLSLVTRGARTYAGTALGVAEFEQGRYARTLGAGLFASAIAVRDDALLVGTLDQTMAEIPLNARPSRGARPLMRDVPGVIQRFIEAEGESYALAADGLYAIDTRSAALRRIVGVDSAQLTDRNVSALAVDAAGRLWVGYFDRGLDILTAALPDRPRERLTHVENEHVFCVNRIAHDTGGGPTAVATANGLVLFDATGRPTQTLGRASGLIADHVTDLILRAGHMIVATPAGLTFIDPDGRRSLSAFHGLVNNHVYALGASGTQVLAGTLGGASVLDDGVIRANYTTANSALTHNWITAVARVDEEWFVGTYGGGLFRLDAKGAWQPFPELTGPLEINPNAMAVTDSHVYAGSLSRGLLVYDRQARTWTIVDAGLPSLNVTALAADTDGVYVGTDNGIVHIKTPQGPITHRP
jgi:ligand-binding sensor domain-containing protein